MGGVCFSHWSSAVVCFLWKVIMFVWDITFFSVKVPECNKQFVRKHSAFWEDKDSLLSVFREEPENISSFL